MKRALIAIVLLFGMCASPSPGRTPQTAIPLLRDLSWTGTGKVFPQGHVLELGISTSVHPFVSARSDTWLLSQGRSSLRSLVIQRSEGWLERNGKREPLPLLMLRQERQQFAIYGQMQLALARARNIRQGNRRMTIKGDGVRSVPTTFIFDAAGRLVEARNYVADSEKPGAKIAQIFKFSGEVVSNGLIWPKHMEMYHGDTPYFILDIQTFNAK